MKDHPPLPNPLSDFSLSIIRINFQSPHFHAQMYTNNYQGGAVAGNFIAAIVTGGLAGLMLYGLHKERAVMVLPYLVLQVLICLID